MPHTPSASFRTHMIGANNRAGGRDWWGLRRPPEEECALELILKEVNI